MIALLLLFLADPAPAPVPPKKSALAVAGDTAHVVQSFPFTVTAPAGGSLYRWRCPAGTEYTKAANVLTVTAAPAGAFKVQVEWAVIDFTAKTVTEFQDETAVTIGAAAKKPPVVTVPAPAPSPIPGLPPFVPAPAVPPVKPPTPAPAPMPTPTATTVPTCVLLWRFGAPPPPVPH